MKARGMLDEACNKLLEVIAGSLSGNGSTRRCRIVSRVSSLPLKY